MSKRLILPALALSSFAGVLRAVENYSSAQLVEGYRKYPIDEHGKLRFLYFNVPALTVTGDADSTYELGNLPPGRVRVLPCLSRITTSAYGSSRTLDVGHAAYQKRGDPAEDFEALNYEAFIANMDISSAVAAAAFSTALKYDLYSVAGVKLVARVQAGTSPIGATMSGLLAYLYE